MIDQCTELIQYTSAEEMAAVYREQAARIRESVLTLGDAFDKLQAAFSQRDSDYGFDARVRYGGHSYGDEHNPDERGAAALLQKLKLRCWGQIIAKLNIRRLMSSQRIEKLDKALAGGDGSDEFPEITPESIRQVAEGMLSSANEFLEEAIVEEYRWWRPWQNDSLKTNSEPWKLSRKLIKHYAIDRGYQSAFRVKYDKEKHFCALANIFRMLDGKGPTPDYKGELCSAIEQIPHGSNSGETEYFKFKCFGGNGNLHLEFKRTDLLDLFNQIAAKRDRLGQQNRGAA